MTRRSTTAVDPSNPGNPDDPETLAQPAIPPGVKAKVRVDYETQVDPNLNERASRYADDLRELAADVEEDDEAPAPYDPLTNFIAEFRNFIGYSLRIVRLPDPAARRIPGSTYNRACFELEQLSDTPFDPANLTGTLQVINGNSGGVFRLWLVDEHGLPIPGARLDRIAIGDPPKRYGPREDSHSFGEGLEYRARYLTEREPAPAPTPPQKSESEVEFDQIKTELFRRALNNALTPPVAPAPVSNLSDEDRVSLLLLNQGQLLPAIMQKLTALAATPDSISKEASWKERAIDATLNLAQSNPEIVERLSGTMLAIVDRFLPNPRRAVEVAPTITHAPEAQRAVPLVNPAPQNIADLPETPDENDNPDEDEDMEIIDQLFELLTSGRPFTVDDPVFVSLKETYPVKFRGALILIANTPLDDVVNWLSDKSALYAELLNSPLTSQLYRARLTELQAFCRAPNAPPPATPVDNDSSTETESAPNKAQS